MRQVRRSWKRRHGARQSRGALPITNLETVRGSLAEKREAQRIRKVVNEEIRQEREAASVYSLIHILEEPEFSKQGDIVQALCGGRIVKRRSLASDAFFFAPWKGGVCQNCKKTRVFKVKRDELVG